ncbi:hypothetical protein Xcel_3060 [Xylanimonas cellulosilytica DSM 15894]|uniref:Uncharacterized protein n=1 Tax=Xylanimonas cellulosilytica (strain DSM 15894 / JCM 12276 / CECT 5975 / KCTC 9989 / LMG 20990 / NBRC 107835 / XIL07) TaxID=446471 RepID=D1BZT4_XYLCX|nr:DUF6191 domain-containing protein [Xylanimonas cellulosilytica]ACZ32062.1 hypothetical protein Xcel_3060 [Xylanimonas cellulosilytica DSM 15894]
MGVNHSLYGPNGEYLGSDGDGGGTGALGELINVFQPSRHHLVDEQERQRIDIVQRPSTADPNGEIDLDSGVVVIAPVAPES